MTAMRFVVAAVPVPWCDRPGRSRLWALFGRPNIEIGGFSFPVIVDIETSLAFRPSFGATGATFSLNTDEFFGEPEDVLCVFEELLDATRLADCELRFIDSDGALWCHGARNQVVF
jgi:hypothetical protein